MIIFIGCDNHHHTQWCSSQFEKFLKLNFELTRNELQSQFKLFILIYNVIYIVIILIYNIIYVVIFLIYT